jgi:hypothetical protein
MEVPSTAPHIHACRCERILHTARRVGDVAETFSTPLVMQSAIVIHRSQSHHQVLRQQMFIVMTTDYSRHRDLACLLVVMDLDGD